MVKDGDIVIIISKQLICCSRVSLNDNFYKRYNIGIGTKCFIASTRSCGCYALRCCNAAFFVGYFKEYDFISYSEQNRLNIKYRRIE
jgi:hypothetical protein